MAVVSATGRTEEEGNGECHCGGVDAAVLNSSQGNSTGKVAFQSKPGGREEMNHMGSEERAF